MGDRVVIIGAGISGLSAGCYARMNGYDVQILESHALPGGLCTSWKRGGYTIDGCIHWLTGTNPKSGFYRIWEELGAIQGRRLFDHEVFSSVVTRDGRTLHWYADVDRLEEHLRELSSGDSAAIRDLCGSIRKLARFPYPVGTAPELSGTLDQLRTLVRLSPYLRSFMQLADRSTLDLSRRFNDPLLRSAAY